MDIGLTMSSFGKRISSSWVFVCTLQTHWSSSEDHDLLTLCCITTSKSSRGIEVDTFSPRAAPMVCSYIPSQQACAGWQPQLWHQYPKPNSRVWVLEEQPYHFGFLHNWTENVSVTPNVTWHDVSCRKADLLHALGSCWLRPKDGEAECCSDVGQNSDAG